MIRPPLRSTLFPYTTLFRSARRGPPLRAAEVALAARGHRRRAGALGVQPHLAGAARLAAAEDRKSTRLNSSHPSISYAVFCLKKKRIHSYLPPPTQFCLLCV